MDNEQLLEELLKLDDDLCISYDWEVEVALVVNSDDFGGTDQAFNVLSNLKDFGYIRSFNSKSSNRRFMTFTIRLTKEQYQFKKSLDMVHM